MSKVLFVLTLVLFFTIPAALAQDTTTELDCDGAQDWYDAVDPDDMVATAFSDSLDTDARMSARFATVESIRTHAETVADMDYPPCAELAREYYLAGLEYMAVGLGSFLDDDLATFLVQQSHAMQQIGQFRGYMQALGVDIYAPDGATIFYK